MTIIVVVSSAIERRRSGTLTTSRDVDVVLSADDLGSEHNFTDLTKDVEIDTRCVFDVQHFPLHASSEKFDSLASF
ncbi:hypothetical protein PV325_000654 [Microctonus aethiopoides]|nr:hypothetical protein PV325_000654 [Microctonus aethiopoides]